MARLNFNLLISDQEYWNESLPSDQAKQYDTLARTLMHRVIDNGNELTGVTLAFPSDCEDFSIFLDFIKTVCETASIHIPKALQSQGYMVTF